MKSNKPEQKKPSGLRKIAEKKLKTKTTTPKTKSDKATEQLIHELQVHQIELEMQNDELRKAQAELEESRSRYSDLYDFAPVGYFTFDKHGLILEANLAAAKELGIERSGLINKPFRSYIVTEDRKLFDSHLQKVFKSDDRQTCEIRLKRKNGSEFYAQLESIVAEESGGNNICRTSLIEITERKWAEEALHESKERYKMLFNSIADAVYVHYVTPEKTGKFISVNESACRMLGYTADELLQMEVKDIDVPEQEAKIPAIHEKLYKDGYALFESFHVAKDGRSIPVEINIRPFEFNGKQAVLSVVRNITKRRKNEEKIRALERRVSNIVDNSLVGVFQSKTNGEILFINDPLRKMFEYESAEDLNLHGGAMALYKNPEDREKLLDLIAENGHIEDYELEFVTKNGKPMYIILCMRMEDDILSGTIVDITKHKRAEEALRTSEENFRSFVKSSSEHIFIIGDDGKYIHSNGRREFELSQERSIIGLNISDVYPQKIAEFYLEQISHVFFTGEKLDFEYHIDESDGIHYYTDTLFPIKHDKIIYTVGGISRDITDIKKIANENDVLSIISHLFLMRESLADIYSELPGILSQKLNFPIVTIEKYDIEASEMVIAGYAGLHGLEKTRLRVPVKQAISGKVVFTGKPIYDLNIKELSEYHGPFFSELNIETFICVPIVIKNKIFGTLTIADVRKRKRIQSYVNTLQVIANHLSQELDRLETQEALIRARDEWEHTFDAIPDLICILDKKFRIVRINLSMAEKLGMQPADCIGKRCYEIIHGAVTPPAFCPHAALLKDGSEHMAENYEEGLGGYFNISTSPIYDKQGQLIGSVHMARDITERKKIEDQIISSLHEKEILLREIHHRVKNNLQIISSLMKLSSESIQDRSIINIFDDSRNRIKSMALIHEKLYQSTDLTRIEFSEYIESLAHELYRAHGVDPEKIILKFSLEPILLSIDIAIPSGLIVNELITNSIKHAFPGETGGEIFISLADEGKGNIGLIISDNGIGIPPSIDLKTTKTFGLYIVNILVQDQLEGSITLDRTKGTTFRITFSKKAEKKK